MPVGLQDARRHKEQVYPELVAGGRCRLVVLAFKIGGRWGEETCTFLRLLATHRARLDFAGPSRLPPTKSPIIGLSISGDWPV